MRRNGFQNICVVIIYFRVKTALKMRILAYNFSKRLTNVKTKHLLRAWLRGSPRVQGNFRCNEMHTYFISEFK